MISRDKSLSCELFNTSKMSIEHLHIPENSPSESQVRIHWVLSNALIIAIIIFSIIMYIYSYDIFKYILMFMVAILLTYNIASYYTGTSFSLYSSSYSETSMWFVTIIIVLSLMLISAYVIINNTTNVPIIIPDYPL